MNNKPAVDAALETALLGLLLKRPSHGYALFQEITAPGGLGDVWRIKQSQLYALLNRLAEEGYVRFELESQPPRPPRKVFHLTSLGRERFTTWLTTPVTRGRDLRLEFLAKLYFAQWTPTDARRLLAQQRVECRSWLAAAATADRAAEDRPFAHLVETFRLGQMEAMITWLNACEQTLLKEET